MGTWTWACSCQQQLQCLLNYHGQPSGANQNVWGWAEKHLPYCTWLGFWCSAWVWLRLFSLCWLLSRICQAHGHHAHSILNVNSLEHLHFQISTCCTMHFTISTCCSVSTADIDYWQPIQKESCLWTAASPWWLGNSSPQVAMCLEALLASLNLHTNCLCKPNFKPCWLDDCHDMFSNM